jgi:steroid 5-alpha reductase family enzyme
MGELAPGLGQNLWVTAIVLLGCVVSLWLLSIRLRDASIIDIFWGPAFGVVAVVGYLLGRNQGIEARQALVTVLTVAWAARLGIYLYWRNHGKGEDPRYTSAFRNRYTTNLHWHTLTKVFLLQGLLVWLISIPVQLAQYLVQPPGLGPMALLGAVLWTIGFLFEAIAAACSTTVCGATAGIRTISATPACGGGCGSSPAIIRSAWRLCFPRS